MRKVVFTISFILAFTLVSLGQVTKSTKAMWGKEATVYHCPLLTKAVYLYVLREKGKEEINSIHLSAGIGRWQRFMWTLPRIKLGKPTTVRTIKRGEKSAMADIVLPIIKNGEKVGTFQVKATQLSQFPNWIFFQQKSSNPDIKVGMYLGVAMMTQMPNKRVPRVLYLAWPGKTVATGESVEWFNTRPEFNAIAWYSRGDKEDAMSEYMVFDPTLFKPIYGVRWKKSDDRACLNFQPVGQHIVFALGSNLRKDEDSKTISVPRFFKEESGNIFEAMTKIDWKSKVDWKALRKKLGEVNKMLKQIPDKKLKKEYNEIRDALKTAIENNDNEAASSLDKKIDVLKKKVTENGLDSLIND